MKRLLLVLFVLSILVCLHAALLAQGSADVSFQSDRKEFRADGDQNRNLVNLVSNGQLQSIKLMTTDFRLVTELFVDSIQDAPRMEFSADVTSLTTGYDDLDSRVLSEDLINLGDIERIDFELLSFATGRVFRLENEKRIEAAGRGVLTLGELVDTVSIDLGLRYLEGNEITALRLPGEMIHLDGAITFRLSNFGIEVPRENRLMVNDQVQLRFDIYASTEYELPAETTSMLNRQSMGEDTSSSAAGQ